MLKKSKNLKKDLKQVQKKSFNNPKTRFSVIFGVTLFTVVLCASYALYSYTGSSLAFNSKVSKKIQVTIKAENGKIGNDTSKKVETDYEQTITEEVIPDEGYGYGSVSCDNEITASYDKETNKLTVKKPTKDTECRVKFEQLQKLKDAILAHNILKEETPDFSKGEPSEDGSVTTGSGIYKAEDDQGESYYFRGDKTQLKNNVKFANQNWKIVRINGDGTIRLILANTDFSSIKSIGPYKFNNYTSNSSTPQHNMVGFTYNNTNSCTKDKPCEVTYNNGTFNNNNFGGQNSTIKTELETWYKDNLKGVDSKIASGYFCNDTSSPRYEYKPNDTSTVYYGAYDRIRNSTPPQPSLKCPDPVDNKGTKRSYGGIYKTKIGLITADEMNIAGLSYNSPYATVDNYLYNSSFWWSLSPSYSDNYAYVFGGYRGYDYSYNTDYANAVVPVINLSTDTLITNGDGSEQSPFRVE